MGGFGDRLGVGPPGQLIGPDIIRPRNKMKYAIRYGTETKRPAGQAVERGTFRNAMAFWIKYIREVIMVSIQMEPVFANQKEVKTIQPFDDSIGLFLNRWPFQL